MAKRKIRKFIKDYPIISIGFVILIFGAVAHLLTHQSSGISHGTHTHSNIPKKEAIASVVPSAGFEAPAQKPIAPPPAREEKVTPIQRWFQPKPAIKKIEKPKIVFVIDDLGYNKRYADLLFSIDRPLTVAILPQITYSKYYAEEAKKRGFETLLHLPLEPESEGEDPGPGLISSRMRAGEVKDILERDLASVPGVVGVNNHMGSRVTRDRALMYLIMKELRSKQLFFLDSMTHPKSAGHRVAYALGMPVLKRDVFLDNIDDYDYISKRIEETAELARETGKAVAIGHIREHTLLAIKDSIPRLEAEGFEISNLKDLT